MNKIFKIKRLIAFTFVFAMVGIFISGESFVFAAAGDGTGGGDGGGNAPLSFSGAFACSVNGNSSSTGASISGSSNVPVQATIKLVFDHNVTDSTIWPTPNKSCISLKDGAGNPVSINAFRIDPAVNDSEKTNLFFSPTSPLAAGTQYTITIAPGLTAKNGNTLGQTVVVSFTTQGYADSSGQSGAGSANSQAAGSGQTSTQANTQEISADGLVSGQSGGSTQTAKKDNNDDIKGLPGFPASWCAAAFIILAGLIVAAGEIFLRTKKKSKDKSNLKDSKDSPKGGGKPEK